MCQNLLSLANGNFSNDEALAVTIRDALAGSMRKVNARTKQTTATLEITTDKIIIIIITHTTNNREQNEHLDVSTCFDCQLAVGEPTMILYLFSTIQPIHSIQHTHTHTYMRASDVSEHTTWLTSQAALYMSGRGTAHTTTYCVRTMISVAERDPWNTKWVGALGSLSCARLASNL